ncbi:hypothetical protein NAEX_03815 [Nannocystis exedens]|nr:hypothetical protein NAEX_03815 [Nannocystis exedens]
MGANIPAALRDAGLPFLVPAHERLLVARGRAS